jgi:small subunit ribosomal protein S3
MGQKVHPIGFRVGISRPWESQWFCADRKTYTTRLHEDLKIRDFIKKRYKDAGISSVLIERESNNVKVIIHSNKPGLVYGRRRDKEEYKGINQLNAELEKLTTSKVQPTHILEVRKADTDSQLVAENIAQQLEKRISYRRAMKKAIQQAMRNGAQGIKIMCSGRLGGADMSRKEWFHEGQVPLHTLRANIDYGFALSHTTYGVIGVKVWIYKGEVDMSDNPLSQNR